MTDNGGYLQAEKGDVEFTPDEEEQFDEYVRPEDDAAVDEWLEYRVRRLGALREQMGRLVLQREHYIDRYERWFGAQAEPLRLKIVEQEQLITGLMLARIAEDPRAAKRLVLPSGTIIAGRESETVEIADDTAFVRWCEEHDRADLTRVADPKPVEPKPDKARVREALKAGEVIPGARLESHPRRVDVDTDI